MNPTLERIRNAGAHALLTFVQSLNAIAGSLAAGALLASTQYPDVVRSTIGQLPHWAQFAALIAFCTVVGVALRQAQKKV